jgi:hypothetical protein
VYVSGHLAVVLPRLLYGSIPSGSLWQDVAELSRSLAFPVDSERIETMKMLPQFSIRLMLGITTLAAGVFSIVGLAVRGHDWAIGVSLGVAGVAVALVTYAGFFGILWVFSVVASPILNRELRAGQRTLAGTTSPFANVPVVAEPESALDANIVEPDEPAGGTTGSVGGGGQS